MHFKYIGTERAVCACPTKHRSWYLYNDFPWLLHWYCIIQCSLSFLFPTRRISWKTMGCICTYNLIVISFLFWTLWCSRHCPFVCLSNSNDLCYSQIHLNCLLATAIQFVSWHFDISIRHREACLEYMHGLYMCKAFVHTPEYEWRWPRLGSGTTIKRFSGSMHQSKQFNF